MAASDRTENREYPISLAQVASDITTLVRQELELAKSEMAEKAKAAGVGAGMLSASAVTGLLALGSLTALVMIALSAVLPLWAAVLIITLLWGAATTTLALLGKRKVQNAGPFMPEQTIRNVKEDIAWARRGANSPRT